jgi:hypothetical protein
MGADYYSADTENGDHTDDPSEDGLFMLLEDLDQTGNTFITITPAAADLAWHASVTLLSSGSYEVERADPARNEQHRDTATDPSDIARSLTIWLAARHCQDDQQDQKPTSETRPRRVELAAGEPRWEPPEQTTSRQTALPEC